MRLISCDVCGVVFDLDKIPKSTESDEFNEFDEFVALDVDNFIPTIRCPYCKNII